jgi:hypothetical protein
MPVHAGGASLSSVAHARGDRGLWQRCQGRVAGLELPDPFDAETFIDALARDRGRPIDLLPVVARPNLPCGLVITTERADWILYQADTSELHRQHILLHEAAHILCGHSESGPEGGAMVAAAQHLMPHLPRELVRTVLGRTVYREPDEREAELVASLIQRRVERRKGRSERRADRRSRLDTLYGISGE